ncbi:TonB-dependent receptor [Shewanella sp. SG41-4]|uniref:TonB-dependent receptor plug domain-containing protein n=1 Tax=Shewanella sp. SG41-4 TaxID=2760976 RepID=UPI00160426D6|nr:TonB-dependent receptor [Shewanella sp. SG41-4]MBB1438891.1 TonB-dependent receptor [Shewanella sp. SG41-4]
MTLANKAIQTIKLNTNYPWVYSSISLAVMFAITPQVMAEQYDKQNSEDIERVEVHGQNTTNKDLLGSAQSLLKKQGVDFSEAGGVSALPILNGMMGDRIKVLIDGSDITSSCANHMNPPLSYVSANQISSTQVVAGVSPVSAGGDNIAGVIKVTSLNPVFTNSDTVIWHSGNASSGYRSTNDAFLAGVNTTAASNTLSFSYQGAFEDANSYTDGNGDKVLDTLYQSQNHALTAAWQDEVQQVAVKLTHQHIPFQGFANQYMDMTNNDSYGALVRYQRTLENDGNFTAQANWHSVEHEMGFFSDEKIGKMPMETKGKDYSYQLHWLLPISSDSTLLIGQEYYVYQLDDIWPAIEGAAMMGPNDYININDGERKRAAVYGEWQQTLNKRWWMSAGIRYEYVSTSTGEVQPYNTMSMMGMTNVNAMAADEFNDLYRKRNDNIIDATLLARYQLSDTEVIELGLARKSRAPNLYERYSWGHSTMATTMIGWYGDGNGYIGNPDLSAETAHTLSVAYKLVQDDLAFNATAWYSDINDYIDANVVSNFNRSNIDGNSRNILQFTNVDATLFGARIDAEYQLAENHSGKWLINANISATRGERDDNDLPLYQIKPLQTELALQQQLGDWQNSISWQWVANKDRVDDQRLENTTDSYSLLNLSSSIQWQDVTMTIAVKNLLDVYYQLPLGGVSIAEYKSDSSNGFKQIAGAGRSLELNVSYAF